ncbi:hypothetical protein [Streptomyces sp. ITFR-16]|uniref:hypothetical protein n=1 Tax=Streptomyces sp. ITFR-16 TaxID=3075198 RepID=UPI00288B2705|nr:hypothetical protein [Streptomyces sp. ITFR-16]WNI21046.1 hypothetical protein RLT58_03495 [Streptomyces sp. ITFR-16]
MRSPARISVFLAALTTAAGVFLAVPGAAQAEEQPTIRELLDKCDNGTDSCVFHPEGDLEEFTGESHQVGDSAFNCTQDNQSSSVTWSDTTGESNSVGVSLSVDYGFAEVFKVSIQTTYQHTWESSHTESEMTTVNVRPGEVGWVTREAQMQRVRGTYELHFPDRFYGHYYWYVPFEATGPLPDASSTKTQHTRAMTEQEKSEHCG